VIHSSSIILKDTLGRSFGAENAKRVFTDSPPLFPSYDVFTSVPFCDFYFHKMGTIHFNVIYQLRDLFASKERKKRARKFAFIVFFNRHFIVVALFQYFPKNVVGTCHIATATTVRVC
jgi:hypothetical protein